MSDTSKIEAIKKMSETSKMDNNPADQIERASPNKEHFDSLMQKSAESVSMDRMDTKSFNVEESEKIETKQVFGDENVSSQKSGSSTDQESKRGRQEAEEVEGIGGVRSKRSAGSTQSGSLMDEVSKLNSRVNELSKQGPEAIKSQAKEAISQLESVKTRLSQPNVEIKPSYQTVMKNRLSHIDDNLKIALNKAGVEYTPAPASKGLESGNPVRKFINMLSDSQNQIERISSSVGSLDKAGNLSPTQLLAVQIKMGYVSQQIELFTSLLNKALESTKTIMNVQV